MVKVDKGDFIELEFTGMANGNVFDTTDKEIANKLGYVGKVKPIKIIIGERMVLKALDDFLVGKEIGKIYEIKIPPEKAFGLRKKELIKIVPLAAFENRDVVREGNTLLIGNVMAKVVRVASGRVLLDLNHPLAGKEIEYKFKILRKIIDEKEKLKAILNYLSIKDYKIELKDGKSLLKLKKHNERAETFIKKYLKNIAIIYE